MKIPQWVREVGSFVWIWLHLWYSTVLMFGAAVLLILSIIPAILFGWSWDAPEVEGPPTEETSTVEMPPVVDPDEEDVARVLRAYRWPCDGPGCVTLSAVVAPLVRQARDNGIEPAVMAGLVMVENPWLDTDAVSHAGAVGLAQVMPNYWDGVFPECGSLYSVEGNLCYGAKILAYYLGVYTTKDRALLAYNGCKPHWTSCNWYSGAVMARGGLAP